ncbi:hypothetical protein CGCF415_v014731 [Colletotrichum fructicola]|uniref:Uncharacterized protein n=2 Tax=Colletotrichum fructicola (strain Nara gc5) TaxID=1213859 RepID=L2FKG6_COLFN|nr:hypothetical protein CFRS1_v009149 [Colletotrichum fructicola]KAF4882679.1 hypothetical protein CGCFRS4_v014330 [Colletotrichum fructicola]KAF4887761.1 hypothetical protein CGCF415_v014731 [Colletotrichum fructicola]KAF4924126.1 hypothetical protein CGCF245_v014666 [Colletotrichum fructicola]
MAPMVLPRADPAGLHTVEPLAGTVMSVIICLVSISIISGFIAQRSSAIKQWRRIPFVVWLVLLIYLDSYLFVFVTAVLQFALGVNTNIQICDGAILLCLVCYITTKVLIYLFLVEKAHIIRGATKPRLKSKLYIFNSFGMLGVYAVIAILNFIFRITRIDDGQCYIGMQKVSMIPLISFDAVVNVYLTILFLIPLKSLYSFKNFPKTPANVRLRTVALRTFVGALCTLTSSIVNLTVLMALDGEPGWVCLMCCNSDILFSAVVVQWVTNKDNAATQGSSGGASRSNDANPFVVDDFRGGPEGGYSPHIAPSQKHVMDDMGEISLDSSTRSEFANSDKGSSEAERQRHASSASTIPSTGAVMVTTTIKRESKPGPALFEEMQIEDGYTAPPSNASSRPMSGRDQEFDNYTRGSRTKITAGKR